MIIKLIRWLMGYVDFIAYGKFPERFINLSVKYGINLWNAHPTEKGICGTMPLSDYRKIRPLCKKAKVRARVTARYGLPFFIKKYKPRLGIAVGGVVGAVLLFLLSNFIWSISITPTENISSAKMLDILNEKGVCIGAYIPSIEVSDVERSILLDADEVGWISVNIKGSTAQVSFKEKIPKPESKDETIPCNIKALSDGVVTEIKTFKGVTQVEKGSGVTQGELLVSGIVETKMNTIEYVHASAEIYADVISKLSIKIPSSYNYYSLAENKTDRYICRFLSFEFPCSLSFEKYENKLTTYGKENLYLNNTILPLQIITHRDTELFSKEVTLTEKEARQIALERAILYEAFSKSDSKVVSRNIKISRSAGKYSADIDYVFNENIAVTSEFSVTD